MKVIAINGSPRAQGNTYTAITLVAEELAHAGIETEVLHVGKDQVQGCTACGGCIRNRDERCVLPGDLVNDAIQSLKEADGILIASPVHYSAVAGTMKSFLDRTFYVAGVNGGLFRHKVGASLVAVRRSGGLTAFDQLNNFLLYAEMLIPASHYWNVIHGARPGEALQDAEGVQILQVLGRNMAWLMKLVEHGREDVPAPIKEKKVNMNFVR